MRSALGDKISQKNPRTQTVVGDRTAGRFSDVKQGSLVRPETVFKRSGAKSAAKLKSRSEPDDRAFVVPRKRVMIVERRDAGKVEV